MRCLLGRELLVQVKHPLDQAHHPVVPHDVGGGGEVDGALRCARDNAPVGRSGAVAAQKVEKFRADAENWAPILGLRVHRTSLC